MIKNEYILSVDIKRKHTAIVPTFVQHDSATLIFKVYDAGKPFDLTDVTSVQVTHKRKDGQVVIGVATYETINGVSIIKYEYMGNEMSVEGFVDTSVTILSGNKKVSIQPFKVCIVADIRDAAGANEEFGVLQDLIMATEEAITNTENATAEAIRATTDAGAATAKANASALNADEKAALVIANEGERKSSEALRKTSEAERETNETTRKSNESARVLEEGVRKTAEGQRVSAETSRKTAESARVTAETKRQTDTATAINNTNTARTNAQTVADNTKYDNDYSHAKAYKKNNIVTYNGSSYMAKQDTTGNYPPDLPITNNLHWGLMSIKGIDGIGTVGTFTEVFTAVEGQRIFNLQNAYNMNQNRVQVFIGGSLQVKGENYTETSNKSITTVDALPLGTDVIINYFGQALPLASDIQTQVNNLQTLVNDSIVPTPFNQEFTATANQTVFTVTNTYIPNKGRVKVIVGGVEQFSGIHFMETNNKTVTLVAGVAVGEKVIISYS